MTTRRNRRWNGKLESLSADFLRDVMEKMETYGDRVQFALPGHAQRPNYQVINRADKKMGFDKQNLLLRLDETGNVADSMSTIFSLEAVKRAIRGEADPAAVRSRSTTTRQSRSGSASSTRSRPAVDVDLVEQDKYAYFRANRDDMPEGIEKYSAAISALMRSGLSAEDAFRQVIQTHFKND